MSDLIDLATVQCYYEALEMLQSVVKERTESTESSVRSKKKSSSSSQHGSAAPLINTVTASAVMAWYGFSTSISERLAEREDRRTEEEEATAEEGREGVTSSMSSSPAATASVNVATIYVGEPSAAAADDVGTSDASPLSQEGVLRLLIRMRDRWTAALAHLLVLPSMAYGASWLAAETKASAEGANDNSPPPTFSSPSEIALASVLAYHHEHQDRFNDASSAYCAVALAESSTPPPPPPPFAVDSPLPTRLFAISCILSDAVHGSAIEPFIFLREALAAREAMLLFACDGAQTTSLANSNTTNTEEACSSNPLVAPLAPPLSAVSASPSPLRCAAVGLFKAVAEARVAALAESFKLPNSIYDALAVEAYITSALTLDLAVDGQKQTRGIENVSAMFPLPFGVALPSFPFPQELKLTSPRGGGGGGADWCVCGPLVPITKALSSHRGGTYFVGFTGGRNVDGSETVVMRLPPFVSSDGKKITASFGTTLLQSDHYILRSTTNPSSTVGHSDATGVDDARGGQEGDPSSPPLKDVHSSTLVAFSSTPDDRRWLEGSYSHLISYLASFAHTVGERFSPPTLHGMLPVVNDLMRAASLLGIDSEVLLLTASVENYASPSSAKARLQMLQLRQHQLKRKEEARKAAGGLNDGDLVHLLEENGGGDAEPANPTDAAIIAMCQEISPTDPTSTHLTLRHHPVRDLTLRLMLHTSLCYKKILAEVRTIVANAAVAVYEDENVMKGVFKLSEEREEARKRRNQPSAAVNDPMLLEASPFAMGLLMNLVHPIVAVTAALPSISFSSPSHQSSLSLPEALVRPNAGIHVIRYAIHEIITTIDVQMFERVDSKRDQLFGSIGIGKWDRVLRGDRRSILKYVAATPLLDAVGDPFLRAQLLAM